MQANLNIISNLNFILVCLNRIVKALSTKKGPTVFPSVLLSQDLLLILFPNDRGFAVGVIVPIVAVIIRFVSVERRLGFAVIVNSGIG